MSQPPIIIAGMHRSGTTLLARMLQEAGVFLGWRREDNEESRTFLEINKWLLLQAGGSWDYPPSPDRFADPETSELCLAFMRYALRSIWFSFYLGQPCWSRGDGVPRLPRPWGWKDPRNTITLPLWMRVYPDARVIHVDRHGVDVAASLLHRHRRRVATWQSKFARRKHFFWFKLRKRRFETGQGSIEDAFELWRRYQQLSQLSEEAIADGFLRVRFEDLLQRPAAELERIAAHIGLEDPDFSKAIRLVRPDRAYAYRRDPKLFGFAERMKDELESFGYSTSPRGGYCFSITKSSAPTTSSKRGRAKGID